LTGLGEVVCQSNQYSDDVAHGAEDGAALRRLDLEQCADFRELNRREPAIFSDNAAGADSDTAANKQSMSASHAMIKQQ
jgi:hypothetical protein